MKTKVCNICKSEKSVEEFYFKDKEHKYLTSECKVCKSKSSVLYARKYAQRTNDKNKTLINRNQIFIKQIKLDSGCTICGYKKCSSALLFHHTHSITKENEVANLTNQSVSLDKIRSEISKCHILCTNCHRKLHYEN